MKVIMLSSDYFPNIGGIAAHIYNLSRALIEHGVQVIVLNPIPGDDFDIQYESENEVPCMKVKYPKYKNRIKRIWARTKITGMAIKKLINEHGHIDVIHQHDHFNSTLAASLYKNHSKWVWTNHSSAFLMDYESFKKRVLMKFVYQNVDGIITVSDELLNKTKHLFSSQKITYIPNGVDIKQFNPRNQIDRRRFGFEESDFIVLCPRRMVEKNGVLYLAKAVSRVIESQPKVKWKFLFLGSDPGYNTDQEYIRDIKKILQKAYEDGYVTYLGNVPMKDMPALNSIADLVVIPSLMEAVSLSALEAMASKKPLITTNVGGLIEIVQNRSTGLLVPSRDSHSLANAIIEMYKNDILREKVSKGGYELAVSQYSWSSVSSKTISFYENVLYNESIS